MSELKEMKLVELAEKVVRTETAIRWTLEYLDTVMGHDVPKVILDFLNEDKTT